jgi:hypothetical protein
MDHVQKSDRFTSFLELASSWWLVSFILRPLHPEEIVTVTYWIEC